MRVGSAGAAGRIWACALVAALIVFGGQALAGVEPAGELFASMSGDDAESRETVPISRRRGAKPRVVISRRVVAQDGLQGGDLLRAVGEVQLSTTCVHAGDARCIGRPYPFSPRMDGRLVLAATRSATGGPAADPISGIETKRCNQRRPNRNHHCVLVFAGVTERVRNPALLPCPPDDCFVNLVVSADHSRAERGNVIVVGADRPDGTVDGDKGRLDVLVQRGQVPRPSVASSSRPIRRTVPIAPGGNRGRRVVQSLRLAGLRRGDVLIVRASQTFGIGGLPYNVFVGTRLILAQGPREIHAKGYAARSVVNGGEISELNGYNCTHGDSAYENPCTSRKSAMALLRRTPHDRRGRPRPLYLNLVAAGLEKLANADSDDRMRVRDGALRAARYRAG